MRIFHHLYHIDTSNQNGSDEFEKLLLGKDIEKIDIVQLDCRNLNPTSKWEDNIVIFFAGVSQCLVFNYTKPFGVSVSLDDYEGIDICGTVLSAKVKKHVNDDYEHHIAVFHEIITTQGEIMLRYGSDSPGYYSCGVNVDIVSYFESEEAYMSFLKKCEIESKLADERHERKMMQNYLRNVDRLKDNTQEKDYTSILNQAMQKKYKQNIGITCIYSKGPSHAPEIKMKVTANGKDYFGVSSSKKVATRIASKQALKDLGIS